MGICQLYVIISRPMLSFILHRGFLLYRRKSVQRFVEQLQHRDHAALQSHGLSDGDSGCRPQRDRSSGDYTKYTCTIPCWTRVRYTAVCRK